MLVAIAGPQGSGKTTVIKTLETHSYSVVETKFSRSVLKDWNVTLEEVNDSYNLSMKFQEELIDRKLKEETKFTNRRNIWFTERTYMDSFVYTLINFGKNNKYSEWLNSYFTKCMERTQIYDLVWYIKGGMFHVKHDGIRGSNHYYARMIDSLLFDYIKMTVHPSKLSIIDYSDIIQRTNILESQTEALNTKWTG